MRGEIHLLRHGRVAGKNQPRDRTSRTVLAVPTLCGGVAGSSGYDSTQSSEISTGKKDCRRVATPSTKTRAAETQPVSFCGKPAARAGSSLFGSHVGQKNFGGRCWRPPFLCFALSALTFSSSRLTSFSRLSWLPCFLFSLSIVQSSSQRCFVAIVECIESLKNDVKQKMVDVSCSLSSTLDENPTQERVGRTNFMITQSELFGAHSVIT